MRHGADAVEGSMPRGTRAVLAVAWLAAVAAIALPSTANAQFFFWDRPRLSADDAARAVIERGFRPLAQPVLNKGVYLADVISRRGRRERLVVSADSGEIVQRFVLGDGPMFRRSVDPTIPRGPIPPAAIPNEDRQPNVFSRLFSHDDDDVERDIAPPPLAPNADQDRSNQQRLRQHRRLPRSVERTPEPVRSIPVESAPLPSSPQPTPAAPVAVSPPADRPVRSIVTNPLSIPGTREQDDKGRASATALAPPVVKPTPPVAKPAAPSSKDVPVAPLE